MPNPSQLAGQSSTAATLLQSQARSRSREFVTQLVRPLTLLLTVFILGTVGFYLLGDGAFSLLDCVYMASITLTTVGYGEVIDIQQHADRDALVGFTIGLMWVGMGVTLYAVSTITTFIVENNLGYLLKDRRMLKEIKALEGHTIVCGLGRTGNHVAQELARTRQPFVVIDRDTEAIGHWKATHPEAGPRLLYIQGDATDELTLQRAGVSRAAGVITALSTDAENLLVVVTVKYINKDLRVVAKVLDVSLVDKVRKAGADAIVSPTYIGGLRLASEMIRPTVVSFLDHMLRSHADTIRVAEVTVSRSSQLSDNPLRHARILERTGMLVIAIRSPEGDFIYNPGPDIVIEPGMVLVVIGGPEAVSRLEAMAA